MLAEVALFRDRYTEAVWHWYSDSKGERPAGRLPSPRTVFGKNELDKWNRLQRFASPRLTTGGRFRLSLAYY